MPSACSVSWDGTSGGKLDESAIPNDDYESHYINDGDTKSDSSFPVVDAEGNLRAGNVRSAWKLRNRGEGVGESCLRDLGNAFDETPLPESAYDNNVATPEITEEDYIAMSLDPEGVQNTGADRVTLGDNDTDGEFGINVEFNQLPEQAITDGFNKYGVRENDDGSLDVRFNVMEPGVRRGAEVTPDFLQNVVSHDYSNIPVQLDHSKSQRANVGFVDPSEVQFADFLQAQAHIPNTGSSIRSDVISDFTHDPPLITDISVGFHPRSVEVEPPASRDGNPVFVDARIKEFSLTPFPAGYDNGGLTPEFSSAVEKTKVCPSNFAEPESQLIKSNHILIKR